jgi:hypothetical protein
MNARVCNFYNHHPMVARVLSIVLLTYSFTGVAGGGYDFFGGKSHTSIHFELYKNLIVIPAVINDSINVKLILDTGTRSMLLYGQRFQSMPHLSTSRRIQISGWGSPEGVDAAFSFPNDIVIGNIKGNGLGVAVVTTRKLFNDRPSIDGIIGYELFVKFVVEINYKTRIINLYDKMPFGHADGFTSIPLEVNKAMPQVKSNIVLKDNSSIEMQLLVDTGSSLGLTLFRKEKFTTNAGNVQRTIGYGLTGVVNGFDLYVKHFLLGSLKIKPRGSHVVNVDNHPDENFTYCGSIGAAFLKKHIVIFDYPSNKLFLRSYKV